MKIGAVDVVVMILFISFVIDRITTGFMFVFSLLPFWHHYFHESASTPNTKNTTDSEKIHQVIYFVIATFLAIIALMYLNMLIEGSSVSHVGILISLGIEDIDKGVDLVVTGLVLVASSDFLGRLIAKSGAYDKTELQSQTIQVAGELTLVRPPDNDASDDADGTHS